MKISTNNLAIKEIINTGKSTQKGYRKLPTSTINGFRRAYFTLLNAKRIEDLYKYKGLNYERLKGDLKDYESIRLDGAYRLIFQSNKNEVIITSVELIEITKHYERI